MGTYTVNANITVREAIS